jgi:hypothetical protein
VAGGEFDGGRTTGWLTRRQFACAGAVAGAVVGSTALPATASAATAARLSRRDLRPTRTKAVRPPRASPPPAGADAARCLDRIETVCRAIAPTTINREHRLGCGSGSAPGWPIRSCPRAVCRGVDARRSCYARHAALGHSAARPARRSAGDGGRLAESAGLISSATRTTRLGRSCGTRCTFLETVPPA